MKKYQQGPSLYYASDKNIFDALNQSRVDNDTVQKLFERRNIISSKKTNRDDLSRYFSRLTHDFLDHQDIAHRLGAIARRERVTSVDLKTAFESEQLSKAIENLATELKADGDVTHITNNGNVISINIKYSVIDYKRSEFTQLQHRDGQIELVKTDNGYVLRSTQSDYIDEARDELIRKLEKEIAKPIEKSFISLFDKPSHKIRSKFFTDLMQKLPGYVRKDVTDVYVYKARLETSLNRISNDDDSHIERVMMKGNGVSQSKLLSDLLIEKNYHISKVGWIAVEKLGKGYGFHIEAMFKDPKDCLGFSYLLKGVYPLEENGQLGKKRRSPTSAEIDSISLAIETQARILMQEIYSATPNPKVGDEDE